MINKDNITLTKWSRHFRAQCFGPHHCLFKRQSVCIRVENVDIASTGFLGSQKRATFLAEGTKKLQHLTTADNV
jgi:hypothetical protein